MAFLVALDACVLYPASLRDCLLRLAEVELFDVKWSDRILVEATNALARDGRVTPEQSAHLMNHMDEAFEDACVSAEAIAPLEVGMSNHPKDRHVLATAVACGAQRVVTLNLKDFPSEACDPHGIEAEHPDDFLLAMLDLAQSRVLRALRQQAADCERPPKSVAQIVEALSLTVPRFAARTGGLLTG